MSFSKSFFNKTPFKNKSEEAKTQENVEQKPLYTDAQWHAVGSVTDAAIKKGAGAYIEVNKGDSYEDPDYYDNLSSEELERKFPKAGDKNK